MLAIALIATLAWSAVRQSKSDVVTLKLAHGLDTDHPVHKGLVYMAELAAKNSAGKLQISIYPGEQLGSEKECIERLQLGILGITKCSSGALEGFIDEYKVFGLPYLFRDKQHQWKVLNGQIGKEILLAGKDKRIRGLCYFDSGARSFYTTNKPIKTPADLKGMKIRVMQTPMSMKMIDAMGGAATPMAWGELYTSLQQGVVDGAENNPPSIVSAQHENVIKYYSLDEHTMLPDVIIISQAQWDALSPEHQRILDDAAQQASDYFRENLWKQAEEKAFQKIAEEGVEIIRPDKTPFIEATRSMYEALDETETGRKIHNLAKQIREVK